MISKYYSAKSFLVFIVTLAISVSLYAQTGEYEVKAAFLYNFAKFVTWPEDIVQSDDKLLLCVIGVDPFGAYLDDLQGKPVRDKSLQIRRISSMDEYNGCNILFVSKSESEQLDFIINSLKGTRGLLTVSDISGFSKHGGIIELLLDGSKVRFAISVTAARDADLNMSSKLLQLATRVEGVQ